MKYMTKCTALFLALALCLTALAGCGEKEPELPTDTDETPGQEQPETPTPEIFSNTIECCDGDTTLRFEHDKQGRWIWKDEPAFPLDITYVEALTASIDKILTLQPITTDKTAEDLGLDSEEKYLAVTDDKGHRLTWYLGDTDSTGCYYMRAAGDESETFYLAPAELTEQISRNIYDMMVLPQVQQMAVDHITALTVVYGEKTLSTAPNESGVWMDGKNNINLKMQDVLEGLSRLQIASCVDFNPSSKAAAICGLEEPQATVTVDFLNSVGIAGTLTFSVGNRLGEGFCVTLPDDSTIYSIEASVLEPLLALIQ